MGGLLSLISNFLTGNEPPVVMIREGATVNDERTFFQIFFRVLDQIPGHRGIGQRWEKEVERVQRWSNNRYDMARVWGERVGYVETLQRVRKFVSGGKFRSKLILLHYWVNQAVRRRENQYKAAVRIHRADPQHKTVLAEWRAVRDTLQNLL